MDGSMIAPEEKKDIPKNLQVDLDQQKPTSTMKVKRGMGATRRSLASINLLKNQQLLPTIDSKDMESNVGLMYNYQNEQSQMFGTELKPQIMTNVNYHHYSSKTSLSPTSFLNSGVNSEAKIQTFSELKASTELNKDRKVLHRSKINELIQ